MQVSGGKKGEGSDGIGHSKLAKSESSHSLGGGNGERGAGSVRGGKKLVPGYLVPVF